MSSCPTTLMVKVYQPPPPTASDDVNRSESIRTDDPPKLRGGIRMSCMPLVEGVQLPVFLDAITPSAWLGAAAVVSGCLWPLCGQRKTMLLFQSTGSVAFALHFFLLGSVTGGVMSSLAVIRICAAALLQRRSMMLVCIMTIPIIAWITVITWEGLSSAFAASAAILAVIAWLQRTPVHTRIVFLCCSGAWVGHDLLVSSTFALIGDALSILCNLIGLTLYAGWHRTGSITMNALWRRARMRIQGPQWMYLLHHEAYGERSLEGLD